MLFISANGPFPVYSANYVSFSLNSSGFCGKMPCQSLVLANKSPKRADGNWLPYLCEDGSKSYKMSVAPGVVYLMGILPSQATAVLFSCLNKFTIGFIGNTQNNLISVTKIYSRPGFLGVWDFQIYTYTIWHFISSLL